MDTHIYVCVCVCVFFQSLSRVQIFMNPWTVACQAPPSVDFPGKNTEMGCHFLPGHLLNPGMEPATWVSCVSCIGRQIVYHWATREAHVSIYLSIYLSTSLHTHTHTHTHTQYCCSVAKSYLTLCNLMDCSIPCFLWVGVPNHLILSQAPSPFAFNLSQHQGLFH